MRKAYEKYKATGIQWLPKIPKHWDWSFLSQIAAEKKVKKIKNEMFPVMSLSYGRIIKKKNINSGLVPNNYDNYQIISRGDIVLRFTDLQNDHTSLRTGLVTEKGIITSAYTNIKPKINSSFLAYLLHAYDNLKIFYGLGGGVRQSIGFKDVRYLQLPIPPREEQEQIVHFLDWKVSSINRLINILKEKKRLILELRQANINYAMYPQKDWTLAPLKQYALSNQASLSSTTPEETIIKYIDINTVGNGYLKNKPEIYTFKDAPLRARRIIHSGDTIVSTVRTYLRSVCFLNNYYEGCVASTGFSVLTPKIGVMPELLGFALTSDYFISQVIKSSTGVSYPAISDNKLMRLQVAFPSELYKQKLLVEKINKMNQKVVSLTNYITQQITNLHDLKSRLIADVVTGQIDVRDVKIPNYEQDAEPSYEANDNATLQSEDKIPEEV